MSLNLRGATSAVRGFLSRNKKCAVSFSVLFVVGIIIGIIVAVNANGGEFERVLQKDVEYGAVKVFFFSSLIIGAGYAVIIVASVSRKVTFVAVVPFLVLGLYFGRYICILTACFGASGIINLIVIYIPFFLCTFICMLFGGCAALQQALICSCSYCGLLRPSVSVLLKAYGINCALSFVIFLILGLMTKVIVIGF